MNISDINLEIDSLCDSSSTSYPAATKLRRVNYALEILVGKIINADGNWQFDDDNYSDTPVGTGTMVEAQQSYSFNDKFLSIEQVSIKDINGVWSVIKPIDPSEFKDIAIEEYFEDTGKPTAYDKHGNTIRLYPAPTATDVTLASGIKIRFKRTADLFTSAQVTTGTKEPGIASPYHILIAYMASIPYCMTYKKDRVPQYQRQVEILTKDMLSFYALREKDTRNIMTTAPIRGGRGFR